MSLRDSTNGGRGFNIADFRAYKDYAGMVKTHDFHVAIPYPAGLIRIPELVLVERNLELTCDSCNFPATGAFTYAVERYGYGALETRPIIPKFSPLQCTFLCDRDTNVWRFFQEWVKITVNYNFGQSINSPSNQYQSGAQAYPYEIGYKEEYAVDFYMYIYSQEGELVRTVFFREAYPVDVGDILMSWGHQNEYVKVPVTFTFMDWQEA